MDTMTRVALYFILAITIATLVVVVVTAGKVAFSIGQDLRKTIKKDNKKSQDNTEE